MHMLTNYKKKILNYNIVQLVEITLLYGGSQLTTTYLFTLKNISA